MKPKSCAQKKYKNQKSATQATLSLKIKTKSNHPNFYLHNSKKMQTD